MDLKNYTQVLIDGKVYTLGGSEDESYLQKAASYVNEKNSAMRKVPGFSKQSADYQTVMTELNITDDYFKAMDHAEEMERQKNHMEKETYSLKHELVSTQMKLEAVLKDLEDRQMELDRQNRRIAELEGELKEANINLQEFRNRPASAGSPQGRTMAEGTARIQVESKEEIKETVELDAALTLDTDSMKPATADGMSDLDASTAAAPAAAAPPVTAPSAETPPAAAAPSAAATQAAAAPSAAATQAAATPSAAATQTAATPSAAATQAAATVVSAPAPSAGGMTDEELARKALQAARKAGSHKGGRR